MVEKYGTGQDPYAYEGSATLINKFNIHDDNILAEAEKDLTTLAAYDIEFKLPPYDLRYFCQLHKQLFVDLFDWAGQLRTIDISKGDTRFCAARYIENEADKVFARLQQENFLQNLPLATFISKLAEYYSEINVLHPFREGNGRTQRILFEHLVINCGYHISFEDIGPDEWIEANVAGYHGDYRPMEAVLARCVASAFDSDD